MLKRLSTSYVYTLMKTDVMYLKLSWKNLEDVLLNVLVNKTAVNCLF